MQPPCDRGRRPRRDWATQQPGKDGWMKMTQLLHDTISLPKHAATVRRLPPKSMGSLPPWFRHWGQLGETIMGYAVPSMADIRSDSDHAAIPVLRVWKTTLKPRY